MSTRTKARIVTAVLAVFTAWPFVHMWLVAEYDLSPWKLAGWGMYSAPRPNYRGMEIYGRAQGAAEMERLGAPTDAVRDEAGRFLERYRWLRRLTAPDRLVEEVRRSHPEWDEIRVVVARSHVEPETGMVVLKEFSYEYPN